MPRLRCLPLLVLCASAVPILAQRISGELRIAVVDPSGLPVQASGLLVSASNDYRLTLETGPDGRYTARELAFGLYRLHLERSGFTSYTGVFEIRSAIPREARIVLGVAPIETSVLVNDAVTLVDPHRTGTSYQVGSDTIARRPAAQPGRAVLDLVQSQPGWLLEANGVLHPRGSEYQVQYVIDGIPLTDNRSPAFAPGMDAGDIQSMNVLTANYPAEYGRKLGGVVEVRQTSDPLPGLHGKIVLAGGSFDTADGYAAAQYGTGRTAVAFSAQGAFTSRYLDPPVTENFTNSATTRGLQARFDRDLTGNDRLNAAVHWTRAAFLVPNERIQQETGQRQDRASGESLGQLAWQHIFSPAVLLNVRGMSRDVTADLWSNSLSTPIAPVQDRGFRETYLNAALSGHAGRHEWKAGGEAVFTSVRESFSYRITDPARFDPDIAPSFAFNGRAPGRERALFIQDLIRAGGFTFSAGLRWDRYALLVSETALSPRLGVAWWWPRAALALRASYDRAFQTPAIENLLLAGSPAVQQLNDNVLRLPVPPSRGDFFQAGFAKSLFGNVRLDANYYRRRFRHFADDDLLLNTGVSFPIAFAGALIQGYEVHLEAPHWGPWSGTLGYSNMIGFGRLPITGGLFLEDAASTLLASSARFPITQDQRNTARGSARFEPSRYGWGALTASYGSGLPVEIDPNTDFDELRREYGAPILNRVNFARGRVGPSFSLDASIGALLPVSDRGKLRIQADVLNLTNRLNVINFAGLFSGTAVGSPRTLALRAQFEF